MWAGHPVARWFQGELENMMLEALCRLEGGDGSEAGLARERGVIRGLRMAVSRLDELAKKTDEDEED